MKLFYTPEAPSGTADLRRPRGVHRRPQSLSGWSFFGWPRCGTQPKKLKKLTPKPCKIEVWRGLGAVLWAVLGDLRSKLLSETILANFGRPWKAEDGAKMGPGSAKMGQMAAPMAASCDQKAPRSTQERQVGALLGASVPIL